MAGNMVIVKWIHDCYLSELQELCVDACRVYGQSSKFGQETDGRVVDLMLGIWDAVSDDDLSSMPITRAGLGWALRLTPMSPEYHPSPS
uniref:Uncharacterized protein n=1 Tax=Vitis vinifera TaxID=29760 RepID=A5AU89_VITVI|nr:hypothetical protein VITISV_043711 [Vitis vinifera]